MMSQIERRQFLICDLKLIKTNHRVRTETNMGVLCCHKFNIHGGLGERFLFYSFFGAHLKNNFPFGN